MLPIGTYQGAFAAVRRNCSVVTWGLSYYGGDAADVADQLDSGAVRIYSTAMAFLAMKRDGNVVAWGSRSHGGILPTCVQA